DTVQLDTEEAPAGSRELLQPIVKNGTRVSTEESLQAIRERAMASLDALPAHLRELTPERQHSVEMSPALLDLRQQTIAHYQAQLADAPD
ncbi:MAG TPA: hypothetical protein VGR22_05675, partial [Thermomicrobiales bacterium]|nr:hypothetical protein [Thermomicrobiales bacterium]